MNHLRGAFGVGVITVWVLSLILPVRPAASEVYIAGFVGANLPNDLSDTKSSLGGTTLSGNDLSLQTSVVYGAKVGYFFNSMKWLGVETELFNATPHLKQQDWTVGGVDLGTLPGASNRVLTWAPLNIVLRYQAGLFEPYVAAGPGVFFSRLSAEGLSNSNTVVGLNTQVGLRLRLGQTIALFGEWKYNRATFDHENLAGTGLNFEADYSANSLVLGLGIHF